MSFLKITFPRILKTSLIIGLSIYIPLSLVISVINVDDQKKKEIVAKPAVVEVNLKLQK